MINDLTLARAKVRLKKLCKLKDFSRLSAEEIEQMKKDVKTMAESGMTEEEICAFFDKASRGRPDHGTDR